MSKKIPTDEYSSPKNGNNKTKSAKKDAKKKPSQEINNIEEFIAFAYSRKGQKVGLNKKIVEVISKAPKLDDKAHGRLLALAYKDKTLAVPRQLILLAMQIEGRPVLKNTIREFVKLVLSKNAVFSSSGVINSLLNKPNAPDPKSALATLARFDYSEIDNQFNTGSIKPRDLEKLRINSVYTLAVWFSETRHLSLDEIAECLFEVLWSPAATSLKENTLRLKVLTEVSNLSATGVVGQIYAAQAAALRRTADKARRMQKSLEDENRRLHEENENVREHLEDSLKKFKNLSEQLIKEQQAHDYTKLCLEDDIEKLRSRMLRRLKAEVTLLDEGLHALRRDPPKVHVMEDHADRALDGLKNEIEYLEKEK